MPLPTDTSGGHLVIASVEVGVNQYGAWRITDLPMLWSEAKQRGSNRVLPGVAGQKAYQRRRDTTERTVTMQVFGDIDGQTGTPYTNMRIGLQTNWMYLQQLVKPTGLTDGTRSATLTLPDGTSLTQTVHVESLEPHDVYKNFMVADLTLSLPGGTFLS